MRLTLISAIALILMSTLTTNAQEQETAVSQNDDYRLFEIRMNGGSNNHIRSKVTGLASTLLSNSNAVTSHFEMEYKVFPLKNWGIGINTISIENISGEATGIDAKYFGFNKVYQYRQEDYVYCFGDSNDIGASFFSIYYRKDISKFRLNVQMGIGSMYMSGIDDANFYGKEIGSNFVNRVKISAGNERIFSIYPKVSLSYKIWSYFGIGASAGLIVPCKRMQVNYETTSVYDNTVVKYGSETLYPGLYAIYDIGLSVYFGSKNKR